MNEPLTDLQFALMAITRAANSEVHRIGELYPGHAIALLAHIERLERIEELAATIVFGYRENQDEIHNKLLAEFAEEITS